MLYWTFILWGSIWLQQIGPGGMLESPTCDPGSSRKRGINCRWIVKGTPLSSHFPRLMAQESPAYSWLLLLRSKSNGFHITHTHQDKMGLPLAGGPHQAPKVMELWPRSVVGKDWLPWENQPKPLSGIHGGQSALHSARHSGITLSLTKERHFTRGLWGKLYFSTKRARVACVPGNPELVFLESGLLVLLKKW